MVRRTVSTTHFFGVFFGKATWTGCFVSNFIIAHFQFYKKLAADWTFKKKVYFFNRSSVFLKLKMEICVLLTLILICPVYSSIVDSPLYHVLTSMFSEKREKNSELCWVVTCDLYNVTNLKISHKYRNIFAEFPIIWHHFLCFLPPNGRFSGQFVWHVFFSVLWTLNTQKNTQKSFQFHSYVCVCVCLFI